MKFVPAVRFGSFLKMGIAAPPGAGKTFTALNIATHLSDKGIALIDSEFRAARKYVGENGFVFDVLELLEPEEDEKGNLIEVKKPFTPQRYMNAIKLAVDSGAYDVLIIDGISEEWVDAGGILQHVDSITRNGNTRDAWKVATPLHKDFINYILRARIHIICTMQAKKEMLSGKGANDKIMGKKITLEPVQREDIERPFDIFALLQDKEMIVTKSRCRPLDGQIIDRPGKEVADILRDWLKGDPMPERPEYVPDAMQRARSAEEVKAYFLKVYKDESKWEGLKSHCLLFPMPDESLGDAELAKLHEQITQAEVEIEKRKQAKAAQPATASSGK